MTYDKNNIFAKILRGEIPCKKLYEDEFALAFADIASAAPIHILVIPKGEYVSFSDFASNAPADLVQGFWQAVEKVANTLGVEKGGYRLITNNGKDAGQIVFHFHVHILAGKKLGKLLAGG